MIEKGTKSSNIIPAVLIIVILAMVLSVFPAGMIFAAGKNNGTNSYSPDIELIPETPDVDNADSDIFGYYNCSNDGIISVGVEVSDEDADNSGLGLKTVKYQVLCEEKETQSGTLFSSDESGTGNEAADDQLSGNKNYSGTINIDANKNNSSDVKVIVTATDWDGNVSTKSVKLDIDLTAPTIAISYDNNSAKNDRYFDNIRTATIVITERTGHFDSDDVKISITAVAADGSIVTDVTASSMISAWKTIEGATADAAAHTATITYSKDANYTFTVSYKDMAGNSTKTTDTGDSVAPYKFTVDTSAPTGTVTYVSASDSTNMTDSIDTEDTADMKKSSDTSTGADTGSSADTKSNSDAKSGLLNQLNFDFYSSGSITVYVDPGDATSPIASVQYYKTSDTIAKTVSELDAISNGWSKFTGLILNSDEQSVIYIKITDRAGNYTYISTDGLIIDRTKPVIEVSYNNTDVLNGNYYRAPRMATIAITEHNFSTEGVIITATSNGSEMTVNPIWSSSGDVHTAMIAFESDAVYTFDIAYKDMAGNDAAHYVKDTFYVDMVDPKIEISGIEDGSANAGTVVPVITVTDANFDSNGIEITLEGMLYGEECNCRISDITYGQTFTFDNIETDDIYVLTVTATDKAGNKSMESIRFSVNRNGSTYDISALKAINQKYLKSENMTDLVITEINPNRLGNITITLYKNGEALILTEKEDYTCEVECNESGWYYYTYTIFREVFTDDGTYSIKISSVDEAENPSENVLDMESEIEFIVDNTEPTIIIANIEEEKTYNSDCYEVIMVINDNMAIYKVEVTLDGEEDYRVWEGDDLQEILNENGDFKFEITESNSARSLSVTVTDAAGNVRTIGVERFWVTTNTWISFHTNLPILIGVLVGLVILIGLKALLIKPHKKVSKNNPQECLENRRTFLWTQ